MGDSLHVVIRTPHDVALDVEVRSLRVLTDTGHVGLRRGMEPVVLDVEAGLAVVRTAEGVRFAGTAGGLLSCNGDDATLFTPLAVVGNDPVAIAAALDRALADPGADLKLRLALDRLEGRILQELRERPARRLSGTGDRP